MGQLELGTSATVHPDLQLAMHQLREQGAAFVLVAKGRVLHIGQGRGVKPLVEAMDRLDPRQLEGAALADKVIGRATALVAAFARLGCVHGEFMSKAAIRELTRRRIPFTYGVEIPSVLNRAGSHLCPFEELLASAESPTEGVRRLRLAFEVGLEEAGRRVLGRAPQALTAPPVEPGSRGETGGERHAEKAIGHRPSRISGHFPAVRHPRSLRYPARRLAQGGLWLATAFVLPLMAHTFGIGPTFLVMHLPVIIAGALLGPGIGAIIGVLAPWLSYFTTGMPPVTPPIAPLMTVELAAYSAAAGWLRPVAVSWIGSHFADSPRASAAEYTWLLLTLIIGRIALGAAAMLVGPLLGLPVPPTVYMRGALLTGIPGIILQLMLVPTIVRRLSQTR